MFAVDRRRPDGLQCWCRTCRNAYCRAYGASNPAKTRLAKYRNTDKAKGLSNDLTEAFVERLLERPCDYCGTTEEPRGLDRLDNSLGHLQANVVPCCAECNRIRSDIHSPDVMRRILGPALALARNEPPPNSH
jgi:hypothetical protein